MLAAARHHAQAAIETAPSVGTNGHGQLRVAKTAHVLPATDADAVLEAIRCEVPPLRAEGNPERREHQYDADAERRRRGSAEREGALLDEIKERRAAPQRGNRDRHGNDAAAAFGGDAQINAAVSGARDLPAGTECSPGRRLHSTATVESTVTTSGNVAFLSIFPCSLSHPASVGFPPVILFAGPRILSDVAGSVFAMAGFSHYHGATFIVPRE